MAYLHTCKGCAFEKASCARREKVRAAIKGLNVTSMKFTCPDRTWRFKTGQRVSFPWRIFGDVDYYGEADETVAVFHGTIIVEASNTRYVVRVDPGPCVSMADEDWGRATAEGTFRNDRLVIKVKTSDITALAESPKPICVDCGGHDDENKCLADEYFRPRSCRNLEATQ